MVKDTGCSKTAMILLKWDYHFFLPLVQFLWLVLMKEITCKLAYQEVYERMVYILGGPLAHGSSRDGLKLKNKKINA